MRTAGLAVAAVFLSCGTAVLLEARPGGGQGYSGGSSGRSSDSGSSSSSSSYSSSSHSSSDSSSSGSGAQTNLPDNPVFTVLAFAFVAFVAYGVFIQAKQERLQAAAGDPGSWDSRRDQPPRPPPPRDMPPQWRPPKDALSLIRGADPEFSVVLFDDFVYGLYAAAQRARRDDGALALLAPYLSPAVRANLAARIPIQPVVSVLVGAARLQGGRVDAANPASRRHEVKIEIESNVTVAAPAPDEPASMCYLKEAWILSREAQAHTRPWKGTRTFGCPACGAPATKIAATGCRACGQALDNGRFDWQVTSVEVLESDPRPPALTGEVEEHGTHFPTVKSPSLDADWGALVTADPAATDQALVARVAEIFAALHAGWAAQDLRPVRPFVSDALLHYLQYWVDAYRAQGLRNAVERARIVKVERAKVTRDLHYDAVTVRLFAAGFEVTTNAAGEVVGGSRANPRPYSEYWTLIRGAEVRGGPARAQACPACGAALNINMAGSCEYCGAHVTAGEFDWVLSRIEQDDSYSG